MAQTNIPWWVNAVYKVGVPTAIACYLVWFLTTRIQSNLEAIQGNLTIHTQQSIQSQEHNKQVLQLLRVICAEGAKNVVERNACFQ